MFTESELSFLRTQRLGRLATTAPDGQPDVAAIALVFDGERFTVKGSRMLQTLKYLNVKKGNPRVALIVDDLASDARPGEGKARGIKIHGTAEIGEQDGQPVLIVTPSRLWSWGIEQRSDHHNPGAMRRA